MPMPHPVDVPYKGVHCNKIAYQCQFWVTDSVIILPWSRSVILLPFSQIWRKTALYASYPSVTGALDLKWSFFRSRSFLPENHENVIRTSFVPLGNTTNKGPCTCDVCNIFGYFDIPPPPLVCNFTQPTVMSFLATSAFGVPTYPQGKNLGYDDCSKTHIQGWLKRLGELPFTLTIQCGCGTHGRGKEDERCSWTCFYNPTHILSFAAIVEPKILSLLTPLPVQTADIICTCPLISLSLSWLNSALPPEMRSLHSASAHVWRSPDSGLRFYFGAGFPFIPRFPPVSGSIYIEL